MPASGSCDGQLGKVLMYQTEFFRNSDVGQWRYYPLTADMTPKNIDWKMFLGTEFGLAPDMPFDRAKYGPMALLLGLRRRHVHRPVRASHDVDAHGDRLAIPGRVVGAGGIYLGIRRPRRAGRGHGRRRFSGRRARPRHRHDVLRRHADPAD